MKVSDDKLLTLLRARFGHDEFRPGQKRVIKDVLAGRDVLAVLPTGAGKSLTYQLAAQLLPGATIVVSPLIALMQDQVDSLEASGVEAGLINSTQSEAQSEKEMEDVETGEAKLLYVTPERFEDEEFLAELKQTPISLFVVDEAHSVSEWGYDFRPAYLRLGSAISQLGHPPVLALTATATPWVREDVIEQLGLRDPDVVVHGTDRPNLFLEVVRVEEEAEKQRLLKKIFAGDNEDRYPDQLAQELRATMSGSGVIYTATTRRAREIAGLLRRWGIPADYYHGQRRKSDRGRVQEEFMRDELRVIVATNAFGLGVDKQDVRFVIHWNIPASVEAYYQEAGRAGRDGTFARCLLMYRPKDLGQAAFLSGTGQLTIDDVRATLDALKANEISTFKSLLAACGLSRSDLARVVELLLDEGIVQERRGRIRLLRPDAKPEHVPLEKEEYRRKYERSRLEMMRAYAELYACRREFVLNYFGEEYPRDRCDMCDNDVLGTTAAHERMTEEAAVESPFSIGDAVVHDTFGKGQIERVEDDRITVLFEEAGYKTLALGPSLEDGTLRPAQ